MTIYSQVLSLIFRMGRLIAAVGAYLTTGQIIPGFV